MSAIFANYVLLGSTALAIIIALLLRFDNKRHSDIAVSGVPITVLILGAGYYVLVTIGVQGLLKYYARSVFVGVFASALTAFISLKKKNNIIG